MPILVQAAGAVSPALLGGPGSWPNAARLPLLGAQGARSARFQLNCRSPGQAPPRSPRNASDGEAAPWPSPPSARTLEAPAQDGLCWAVRARHPSFVWVLPTMGVASALLETKVTLRSVSASLTPRN